jgi:hypothetical protein
MGTEFQFGKGRKVLQWMVMMVMNVLTTNDLCNLSMVQMVNFMTCKFYYI